MNERGTLFIVAGIMFLVNAGIQAPKAPNFSYLMGTFLPGMFFLIWGLKKRQKSQLADEERRRAEDGDRLTGSEIARREMK